MENKKRILLSTAYFPPIHYFSFLVNSEEIFFEKFENFIKQTYRNRCIILTANGILNLSIPVKKSGKLKTLIKDVEIDYKTKWQKNHFKSIESAYKSSPFFDFYIDDLIIFFEKRYKFLYDYNLEIINSLKDILMIDFEIKETSDFIELEKNNFNDLRYSFSPKYVEKTAINYPKYNQVFKEKFDFIPNLSILDLIFNLGNETCDYLKTGF